MLKPISNPVRTEIAIIGMAGRFPGAGNIEAYWRNLCEGVESVTVLDRETMVRDGVPRRVLDEAKYVRAVAAIDDYDSFDAEFFGIRAADAQMLDPQQRLMLEAAWHAIESAGYAPDDIDERVGVFAGAGGIVTSQLLSCAAQFDEVIGRTGGEWHLANDKDFVATRISYKLNLRGPSLTVQTACSTSLVALHLACQSLRNDECDLALAGAVSVRVPHRAGYFVENGGIYSASGRVRAFDDAADGVVFGSGVGLVLLKPLDRALADGDTIRAVIKGTAVNNDGGRKMSFMATRQEGQVECITQAFNDAGVSPSSIGFVESHGTGTAMGDPVELSALTQAFRDNGAGGSGYCALGAVKNNIGHLDIAAGIASLIKAVLTLERRTIAPCINYATPNRRIDFAASPFHVNTAPLAWPAGDTPRRAAVNCLGIGGTNAFVILEEAPAVQRPDPGDAPWRLVVLSARTEAALARRIEAMLQWLAEHPQAPLADIAYTLSSGRAHHTERCALLVTDCADLSAKLARLVARRRAADTYTGSRTRREFSAGLVEFAARTVTELGRDESRDADTLKAGLVTIADLYCQGVEIDFQPLYANAGCRRMVLPGYSFETRRFALPLPLAPQPDALPAQPGATAVLHPLLHRNVSDLAGLRFESTLTGDEFFLRDHVVDGVRVLPGVAQLEMVVAAMRAATPGASNGSTAVQLGGIVWLQPITVGDAPRVVAVCLAPQQNGFQFRLADAAGTVYCHGTGRLGPAAQESSADLPSLRARLPGDGLAPDERYARFAAAGLAYGPAFRGIRELWHGEGEVLAHLELPAQHAPSDARYLLHPALLDAALQASMALSMPQLRGAPLPFTLGSIAVDRPLPASCWVSVRAHDRAAPDGRVAKFDIDLYDDAGAPVARLASYVARGSATAAAVTGRLLFEPGWEARALAPERAAEAVRRVFLLGWREHIAVPVTIALADAVAVYADDAVSGAQAFVDAADRLRAGLRELAASAPAGNVRVQVVVPADSEGLPGLAGMLKTVQLENSRLSLQLVCAPSDATAAALAALVDAEAAGSDEVVRIVDGRRETPVLRELAAPASAPPPWRADGVYWITGGAGGVGLLLAHEIVRHAPRARLILTGRSARSAAIADRLAPLLQAGAQVEYHAIDTADTARMRALADDCRRRWGAVHGVVHAAGVIRDSFIVNKTADEFRAVLAPKVAGIVALDAATADLPLDFFIAFSSLTSVTGNIGQTDYAAANGFLDEYMPRRAELVQRGERSGRSLAVNWPLWAEGGMRLDAASERLLLQRHGLVPMSTATAWSAMYDALALGGARVVVLEGDEAQIRRRIAPQKPVAEPRRASAAATGTITHDVSAQLQSRLLDALAASVARILHVSADDLDVGTELAEYGFDSIGLTSFANALNERFGLDLLPSIFFEFPTLAGLSAALVRTHSAPLAAHFGITPTVSQTVPAHESEPSPEHAPEPVPAASAAVWRGFDSVVPAIAAAPTIAPVVAPAEAEPIAIVGMSGRFPKAPDLEALWANLVDERDCIDEIPASRWDWRKPYGEPLAETGRRSVRWGGFIDGVDEFDPLFFGISPHEAVLMDPHQRLVLQHAIAAIEDAGYAPASLAGTDTAVFVGTNASGYADRVMRARLAIEGYSSTGAVPSVGPNRLSFFLDLHGPSEPVETACSSSLIALHRAVEALHAGACAAALCGGVQALVTPDYHISFGRAGMLCEDGRCKSFSDRANGYVRGEGVGLLFVKRLSAAERDGDHIYGVIRGSAENHGGRANSLTAPNPAAQAALLEAAYRTAGIDPRTVGYIEAHGTGTELGDPVEVNALKSAFAALYARAGAPAAAQPHCGLGTIKSNIGHLELAAGIAGVIKVLLQFKHGVLVKTLHCERLNPYIDFAGSPFYVVQDTRAWEAPVDAAGRALPRRAGVSSFGFGGANAHVVLEEYVDARERIAARGPFAVVLSAKDDARLREQVQRLLAALDGIEAAAIGDLAYTLQVGRDAMTQRLAFIVSDVADLADKLGRHLAGEAVPDSFRGEARRGRGALTALAGDAEIGRAAAVWFAQGQLGKLLRLWVEGLTIDWTAFYVGRQPRRLSLPTYPFARERYWVDPIPLVAGASGEAASSAASDAPLHPLLHRNSSTLLEQRFSARFDAGDAAVANDRLSPFALLAMLPVAAQQSLVADGSWRFERIAWGAPAPAGRLVHLGVFGADGGAAFELYSEGPNGRVVHGQAFGVARPAEPAEALIDAALRTACEGGAGLPALLERAAGGGEPQSLARLDVFGDSAAASWFALRDDASGIVLELGAANGALLLRLEGLVLVAPAAVNEILLLGDRWHDAAPASAPAPWRGAARHVLTMGLDPARFGAPVPAGTSWRDLGDGADFVAAATALFDQIQTALLARPDAEVLVQVATTANAALAAGFAALLRSAHLENPLLRGQVIELDTEDDAWARLDGEAVSAAPRVRYVDGRRQVHAFAELDAAAPAITERLPLWKEGGRYLITGGAGGLGLLLAQWLTQRLVAVDLVLTGRSELDAARRARIDGLRRPGVTLSYRAVAVDDAAAMAALFDDLARDGGVDGIVHAAGLLRDDYIVRKSAADVAAVAAPKVAGVELLDALARAADFDLDFLLLFSSTSAAFGNAGQSDYAAANGYLDGWAQRREAQRARGERRGRTLSIAWPLWQDGGMQVDPATLERLRERGMEALAGTTGWRVLESAAASAEPHVVVLSGEIARLRASLAAAPTPAPVAAAQPGDEPVALRDPLLRRLKGLLSAATKIPLARIDVREALEHYGIDSLLVTRLNAELESVFGPLSKTLLFEYRTLEALAEHLAPRHADAVRRWCGIGAEPAVAPATRAASGARPALTPLARAARAASREPIAIIGLAGRYPQARDLDAFWANLAAGRDAIVEIPAERWPVDAGFEADPDAAVASGRYYARWGGFVDGFADFDPQFFNISPRDAYNMDPQERLLVETCWAAIEDAGYTRARLSRRHGNRVGVFAGITKTGYERHDGAAGLHGEPIAPFTSFASMANRVSYLLDLNGPSLPIDTMCSASLTAIHEACEHLYRDDCELALAGGVNLYLHPSSYVALCAQRMLSPNGRCMSFGAGGDGFVPGEGVGVVLLKRLSAAQRDNDAIRAVIRGTAINHGGKTNGYTVPNPTAQADVVRLALARANVDAREVSYIEAHGTGTRLGDPIEIAGLAQAFATSGRGSCAIGSLKTNIGHLEAAAGIAGLTKVLLQLQHGELVPSLHARALNPNIDFAATPFVVQRERGPWQRPLRADGSAGSRIAGISSFGAGGANAHIVVEEYRTPPLSPPAPASRGPHLIVLSARTAERLSVQAARLLTAIESLHDADLPSIAYTLKVGREAMEHRLGVAVSSLAQLRDALRRYIDGEAPDDVHVGQVKRHRETLEGVDGDDDVRQLVSVWIEKGKFDHLLRLWTRGLTVDWEALQGGEACRLLRLPTYPFARERYWIASPPARYDAPAPPAVAQIRPDPAVTDRRLLVAAWETLTDIDRRATAPASGATAVIGAEPADHARFAAVYAGAAFHEAPDAQTAGLLAQNIVQAGSVAQIVWRIGAGGAGSEGLCGFVAALLDAAAPPALDWIVLAPGASPQAAMTRSFMTGVAASQTHWSVAFVELDEADALPVEALPHLAAGESLRYRDGEWSRRQWVPLDLADSDAPVCRVMGSYAVLGRIDGAAAPWIEWLIRSYQIRIVWFVQDDAGIEATLQRLQQFGPRPRHVAVDALDAAASHRADSADGTSAAAFDGVIWTGDYGASDSADPQSLARDLAHRLHEFTALRERLAGTLPDFVLALSSPGGTPAQIARSAFDEALALRLAAELGCAGKVLAGDGAVTGDVLTDAARHALQALFAVPVDRLVMGED